jgi:hypothetical protein
MSTGSDHTRRQCAAVGVIVGTGPAAYWLIPTSDLKPVDRPQYYWRPPAWSSTIVRATGAAALVLVVLGGIILYGEHRAGRLSRHGLRAIAYWATIGVVLAGCYRGLTEPFIGAPIGIQILLVLPPVLGTLLVLLGVREWRRGQWPTRPSDPPPSAPVR